jgi:hypothetical protein
VKSLRLYPRLVKAFRPGRIGPPSDPEPPADPPDLDVLPFQPNPPRVVDIVEEADGTGIRLVAGE